MTASTLTCINDVLSVEILQKIFLLSAESFNDALNISKTCQLWRKLIFNPFIIEQYWRFNDKHRKSGLVQWWNFNEQINNQHNPFVNFPTVDCFLGKYVCIIHTKENYDKVNINDAKCVIDRASDYSLALWFLTHEKGNYYKFCQNNFKLTMIGYFQSDQEKKYGSYLDEREVNKSFHTKYQIKHIFIYIIQLVKI